MQSPAASITACNTLGGDKQQTPWTPLPSSFKYSVTSTQTEHLEIHAPGARNPVVEAQDNDTGHQGSQHEGRRLHAPTPVSQSHHLTDQAENLPNKSKHTGLSTSITMPQARHMRHHNQHEGVPPRNTGWRPLLEMQSRRWRRLCK